MPDLNLNAHVPVSGEPLVSEGLPSAIPRAPFSVEVGAGEPLGDNFTDYVPGDGEQRATEAPTNIVDVSSLVVEQGVDWRSGKDSQKVTKDRKAKVTELAKSIYSSSKTAVSRYEQACKIVNTASEEDLLDPDKRLLKAQKIMDRGRPMTKKKAVELATQKINRSVEGGR